MSSIPYFPDSPEFPVLTRTLWSQRPTTSVEQLQAKAQEMLDANLTSTITGKYDPEHEGEEFVVMRNWISTEAANEWISFVNGLNIPELVSISIES